MGKTELLSVLKLYFPSQVTVLSELMFEVAAHEELDLFRDRDRLREAILRAVLRRQAAIREALARGQAVVEESHLGLHAACSAALGGRAFLEEFFRLEGELLWPDVFVRMEASIPVSLVRQRARGDPRYTVEAKALERMEAWLSQWHGKRGHELVVIDADRPPHEVLGKLVTILGLRYRSIPRGRRVPLHHPPQAPCSGEIQVDPTPPPPSPG